MQIRLLFDGSPHGLDNMATTIAITVDGRRQADFDMQSFSEEQGLVLCIPMRADDFRPHKIVIEIR